MEPKDGRPDTTGEVNADVMEMMARVLRQNQELLERLSLTQSSRQTTSEVSMRVAPDASTAIPKFTGIEGDIVANEWINEFIQIAELARWDEEEKITVAKLKLSGPARDWQHSTGGACKTWSSWEAAFRDAYVRPPSKTQQWRLMERRVQRKGENHETYVRDKEKLCVRLGLTLDETKEEIVTGLSSRDLSYAMRNRPHLSINDLLRDITSYECFQKNRDARFCSDRKQEDERPRQTSRAESSSSRAENDDSKHAQPKEPKCCNCQKFGHLARDCPDSRREKTCTRCGKQGHGTKTCPEQRENALHVVNLKGEDRHEVCGTSQELKSVIVDGEPTAALLDTGAQISLIKSKLATQLGKKVAVPGQMEQICGVGGTCETFGEIQADLEVDSNFFKDVRMQVVPDNTFTGPDIIVGTDVIDTPNIVLLRKEGKTMLLDERDCPFLNEIKVGQDNTRVVLSTRDKVKIERNTVQWVTLVANCDEQNSHLLVPGEDGMDYLCELKDGETSLPIMNVANCDIILKKRQPVKRGDLVELEETDEQMIPQHVVHYVERGKESLSTINMEEIKVGPSVTEKQKKELCEMLNRNRECFAMSTRELGCTTVATMTIEEKPGSAPVGRPPYRASWTERQILRQITDELKTNGLVRDSESEYSSPVILVKKKTGEYRMVVDYRRLNMQTIRDRFPLPIIDDVLDRLAGNSLFTVLDMAHGYFQIPLDETSMKKAAFTTPDGHFEPVRMFFGLTNGPPVYQRMISKVLGPLGWNVATCYLDDILVAAQNWEEMIGKLQQVFEAISNARLTLRLSKCEFAKTEVEYLGFVLTTKGIKPGTRKLAALTELPAPKNVTQLQRFLGLTSFFRRFVPCYAAVAAPLHRLLKSQNDFKWSEDADQAFNELKNKLVSDPILQFFDRRETKLHTDASSKGLAGMLLQKDGANTWHLVYCVSRRTSEVEQKVPLQSA